MLALHSHPYSPKVRAAVATPCLGYPGIWHVGDLSACPSPQGRHRAAESPRLRSVLCLGPVRSEVGQDDVYEAAE